MKRGSNPDITFFGFDLTVAEAKGNPATNDAGWFFVIKERPGEPRFGLDISRAAGAPHQHLERSRLGRRDGAEPAAAHQCGHDRNTSSPRRRQRRKGQRSWPSTTKTSWCVESVTNAADVAYVLYQLPVLVAVHAAEMLPKD